MGITAKFSGKCVLCGGHYPEGAQVDRAPGYDKGRAHVECLNKPATPAPRQSPPTPPASVPATAATDTTLTHLHAMRSGIDLAVQGLGAAMVALDGLIAARGGRR